MNTQNMFQFLIISIAIISFALAQHIFAKLCLTGDRKLKIYGYAFSFITSMLSIIVVYQLFVH